MQLSISLYMTVAKNECSEDEDKKRRLCHGLISLLSWYLVCEMQRVKLVGSLWFCTFLGLWKSCSTPSNPVLLSLSWILLFARVLLILVALPLIRIHNLSSKLANCIYNKLGNKGHKFYKENRSGRWAKK